MFDILPKRSRQAGLQGGTKSIRGGPLGHWTLGIPIAVVAFEQRMSGGTGEPLFASLLLPCVIQGDRMATLTQTHDREMEPDLLSLY
jgi:hypothetical protein